MTRAEATAYRRKIETAAGTMSDSAALSAVELFPEWEQNKAYAVSERVRHGGTLYRCVQAHTSQADWTPDAAPALWVRVSVDEYPDWVQPTGAHDAYNTGDKVTYNGGRYISAVDGNTYAPDVYGWEATT
nr:MAG TPA: ChiA1-BD-binding domain protein [Caudoviricetes sp.]